MGLDQAVLKGFESGDGSLSKSEIEKLLRHGAYDILNEEKAGTAEAESNNFVQLDIDAILERRSRTVVHDNTGSNSNAAGGTFSKASFKVAKSPEASGGKGSANGEEIDIEDPDFWKKMLGESLFKESDDNLIQQRRKRNATNYCESAFTKDVDATLFESGDSSDSDKEDDEESVGLRERTKWGGESSLNQWKKDDVDKVIKAMLTFGYGNRATELLISDKEFRYSALEV